MSVYVDPLMNHGGSATFRWKRSCHLFADSLDELHAFAKSIGMKKEWFQPNKTVDHYDLNENRHRIALLKGAIQLDRNDSIMKWRELRCQS